RLLEDKEPERGIGKGNSCRNEKRRARSEGASEESTDRWPENKADAKRGAGESEISGPILGRRNVGDISICRRVGTRCHARQEARDEEPGNCRSETGQEIVYPDRNE